MTDDRLAAFANQSSVSPLHVQNGNTPWAQRYAADLKDVVLRYAARSPRTLQRHLGPSEIGSHCDRQLVGKMAGVQFRGHAGAIGNTYAWASIVGTAIHAYLEEAFKWDASPEGGNPGRWFTEHRVTPDPGAEQPHPGTADLYDTLYFSVDDHKAQSEAVRSRLRRDGIPYHYFIQLLLYALGYIREGRDVRRVVLISWPRTKSDLSDLYVFEHVITPADIELVLEVLRKTEVREKLAKYMAAGQLNFFDVPATPSEADCQFCGFFNAAAVSDGTSQGCPGTSLKKQGF